MESNDHPKDLRSPLVRLQIGLEDCRKILAVPGISEQVRRDQEVLERNILQAMHALSPEGYEEARQALGHEPTGVEVVLYFIKVHAEEYALTH
ncbi:MAG TPA: hypothetical protein VHD69_00155 [Candidatus Paceibacterota bacterium]|jgi:hypothetical protein|nr:hypothetical protein [Candidatus Paceibacterota bacterium]